MSADFDYVPVNFGELDWEDGSFAVLPYTDTKQLEESLERFGILQPPWILKRAGGKAVIVDGYRRLQWLRRNGREKATCLVFPAGSNLTDVWLRRIEGKLFGAPLNVSEKAQIVARLSELTDAYGTWRMLLSRLGVSSRPDSLAKWVRLASAGVALLEAAASEEICERAAMELLDWEEGARERMLPLLKDLRSSASIQVEILERLREIALREGKSKIEIMDDPALDRIVRDPGTNHREKTRDLRAWLNRRRFPRLAARAELFRERVSLLKLPGAVHLIPPPSFEGEQWQLQVFFSGPEELSELLEEAQSRAQSTSLSEVMASSI